MDITSGTEEYYTRRILEIMSKDPTKPYSLEAIKDKFLGDALYSPENLKTGYYKATDILNNGVPKAPVAKRVSFKGGGVVDAEKALNELYDWSSPIRRNVPIKANTIVEELKSTSVTNAAVVGLVLKNLTAKGIVKAIKPNWQHASSSYFMPHLKDGSSKDAATQKKGSFGKPMPTTGGFKPAFPKLGAKVVSKTLFEYTMPKGCTTKDALELYELLSVFIVDAKIDSTVTLNLAGDTKSLSITRG